MLTVNDAAYVNDAIMLCASVPCVLYGTSSPSSPAFFADLSLTFFYTPWSPLLLLPSFILQIISCAVITFPLLTVALPLATLCVCVCVCLWWPMAGHWPLPLLGKLCLCPWGLQICDTPEPQLQLWAQAGAKSLLLTFLSWTISDQLVWVISYLSSQGLYLHLLLYASQSASLPLTPSHPRLHLVFHHRLTNHVHCEISSLPGARLISYQSCTHCR